MTGMKGMKEFETSPKGRRNQNLFEKEIELF